MATEMVAFNCPFCDHHEVEATVRVSDRGDVFDVADFGSTADREHTCQFVRHVPYDRMGEPFRLKVLAVAQEAYVNRLADMANDQV